MDEAREAKRKLPTIEELEKILDDPERKEIQILPNGEIRVKESKLITCFRCGLKYDPGVEPGGLVWIPTDNPLLFEKYHLCRSCCDDWKSLRKDSPNGRK